MMQRHEANVGIDAANECWSRLGTEDWLQAISHHPRIGEKVSGAEASEQAAAQSAERTKKDQLVDINREYENKFGHIYIVCASGKSVDEMLAIARSRLDNDAETELKVAAEEIRKIMNLRLEKLLEHT